MDDSALGSIDQDESALVARLQKGEALAFEQLVREFGAQLLASVRRVLNDEAAAEDCVQEAFLNAFRGIKNFQGRSRLTTWLHRIAINCAISKWRENTPKTEVPIDESFIEHDEYGCRVEPNWRFESSVDEEFGRQEMRGYVQSKIAELPERLRVVLVLRDIEELSIAETADMLALTEAAVKSRLHRARLALKKLLEPVFKGER